MFVVSGLLRNAFTCLYGNQTSSFFQLEPPSFVSVSRTLRFAYPEYLFSLDFIYFKAFKADIFTKTTLKDFQGLEMRLMIFNDFHGFSRRVPTLDFRFYQIDGFSNLLFAYLFIFIGKRTV